MAEITTLTPQSTQSGRASGVGRAGEAMAPSVLVLADEILVAQMLATTIAACGPFSTVPQKGWAQLMRAVEEPGGESPRVLLRFADHLDEAELSRVRRLREAQPTVGVGLMARSFHLPGIYDLAAQRAAGLSILLRDGTLRVATLVRAILQLGTGVATMTPEVLQALVGGQHDSGELAALSADELSVLELVATGLRNCEIARRLHFSEKLIEKRIGCIFEKLQLNAESSRRLDRRATAIRLFLMHQHRRDILSH